MKHFTIADLHEAPPGTFIEECLDPGVFHRLKRFLRGEDVHDWRAIGVSDGHGSIVTYGTVHLPDGNAMQVKTENGLIMTAHIEGWQVHNRLRSTNRFEGRV